VNRSDGDLLEVDVGPIKAGEVSLDVVQRGHSVHERRGADEVGFLHEFESWFFEFEAVAVERAALVRDQHDALELVDLNEELKFIDDTFFFEVCLRMSGEARGSAGEAEAVVAREVEAVLEEVVEVLTESAVGAIEGRGVDAGGVVLEFGFVRHTGLVIGGKERRGARVMLPESRAGSGRTDPGAHKQEVLRDVKNRSWSGNQIEELTPGMLRIEDAALRGKGAWVRGARRRRCGPRRKNESERFRRGRKAARL